MTLKHIFVGTLFAGPVLMLTATAPGARDDVRPISDTPAYHAAKGEALDAYIAGRLITAFTLSEHLAPYGIEVSVKDGVVTLDGTVSNTIVRDLALEIARGVEGVADVRSHLHVAEQAQAQPHAPGDEGFARRFDDATITARVKTRLLWNGNTGGLAINVDTREQVVTLSGSVDSAAQKALAEQIARNTDGVRRVDNRLNVEKITANRS